MFQALEIKIGRINISYRKPGSFIALGLVIVRWHFIVSRISIDGFVTRGLVLVDTRGWSFFITGYFFLFLLIEPPFF